MGIDVTVWRIRIGLNSQPRRLKCMLKVLVVSRSAVYVTLRILLCAFMLILMGGDVEVNPGPPKTNITGRTGKQPGDVQSDTGGVRTRQRTLSFSYSQPSEGRRASLPRISESGQTSGQNDLDKGEIMNFLQNMKLELKQQNDRVANDISQVHAKVDTISQSINDLKAENSELKLQNESLRRDMDHLTNKLETLEGQSRRNNLRFHGIPGHLNESWEESESKIRAFIRDTLALPEKENVEIERAHRIKSRDRDKCTIIVKFGKYKDRECIVKQANTTLTHESPFSVQPDFTDRVKKHRREVGKIMISERSNGNYASIRYNKLIINDSVYRYDDDNDTVVNIGKRTTGTLPRGTVYKHSNPAIRLDDRLSHDIHTDEPVAASSSSGCALAGEPRGHPIRADPSESTSETDAHSDTSTVD